MASHKSAKKRIRTNLRKKAVNQIAESRIKTTVKKAMAASEKETAEKLYKDAVAILDKSAANGILHKNNAARKKAALTRHLNSLQADK
jgi:small subunit ribosomal protein S20